MNREETKQAIEVMQAYVDGAEIELKAQTFSETSDWVPLNSIEPVWHWPVYLYRIKPKPQEGYVMPRDIHIYSHRCDEECIKVREVLE